MQSLMVGAKIIRVCKTSGNACHHRSRGSSAIVPLYLRGSKIFSRGFFVSPDFLLVVNTWVRNLFSWVFGYFVGTKFFLLGISLAENFFSWVFRGSESFSREYFVGPFFFLRPNFLIQRFSVARYMRRSDRNRNTKIHLKPCILF